MMQLLRVGKILAIDASSQNQLGLKMTSSTQTSGLVAVVTAIITAVATVLATNGTPVVEHLIGKTVKADAYEAVQKSEKAAIEAKTAAENEVASLKLRVDAMEADLAQALQEKDKFKRIIDENNRPPQVERISMGGSHLFAGTDLKLKLVGIFGASDDYSANLEYNGVKYRVSSGATGSASIVTEQNRNCDVAARSISSDFVVLVVDCKATQ